MSAAYVAEWGNRDKRDLSRITACRVTNEIDSVRPALCRFGPYLGPSRLCEGRNGVCLWAGSDGNIAMPSLGEEARCQSGTQISIAPGCGHADDMQLRCRKGERQGKGVIDVVSDICVNE